MAISQGQDADLPSSRIVFVRAASSKSPNSLHERNGSSDRIEGVKPRAGSPWTSRIALLLPVAVLMAFFAWAILRHQQSQAVGAALARGETPPAPAATFLAFDGRRVSLRTFAAHPVVLNFWASWCVPCREEA